MGEHTEETRGRQPTAATAACRHTYGGNHQHRRLHPNDIDFRSAAAELLDRDVEADGIDDLVCQNSLPVCLATLPPKKLRWSQPSRG